MLGDEDRVVVAMRPEPKMALALWRDAHFDFDFDAARPDYIVQTLGFVIDEGPMFLSIASEMLPAGDGYRAVTHIPRSCVVSVIALGPTEPTPA